MRLPSARLIDAGAYGIIAVWTAIALYISIANPAIQESDMFGFIERAEKLSRENWSAWVDGFYPLGYPLLLRILFHFTGDYVVAGKALSLVSGVGGLFAIYGIAKIAFSTPVALLALGFCCLNRVYLGYSVTPSTDMPATGLLLLGIYGICLFSSRHALKYLFWSGAAFGLSYLMRYTTITVIPVVFVWLLLQPRTPQLPQSSLALAGIFIICVAIFALPQLVASFLQQGNPFYNRQAQNVYFGMFGGSNWGLNIYDSRNSNITLTSIIVNNPDAFLHHWLDNMLSLPNLGLVIRPLFLLAFAGLLLSIKHRAVYSMRFLLLLIIAAFAATICIAFASGRLLLLTAPLICIFAAFGVVAGAPKQVEIMPQWRVPVRIPFIIALVGGLVWVNALPSIARPISDFDYDKIKVSEALIQHGMRRPSEVLAFSFYYYDLSKPTKDRFSIPWYETEFKAFQSVSNIVARMQANGQRFLVFDDHAPDTVRGLKNIWPFSVSEMTRYFEQVPIPSASAQVYQLKTGA